MREAIQRRIHLLAARQRLVIRKADMEQVLVARSL
jgi:hypothetical protein